MPRRSYAGEYLKIKETFVTVHMALSREVFPSRSVLLGTEWTATIFCSMKIIISPAKKMNVCDDILEVSGLPDLIQETEQLCCRLKKMSYGELKALWNCNDKIAALNEARVRDMDLYGRLSPALLAYEGIQYQYMAPQVFTDSQWDYAQKNLRILSGFYGILRPRDGIVPYRLEMQAKLSVGEEKDLYNYWKEKIAEKLTEDQYEPVLNLASKEYSRAVEPYIGGHTPFVTCIFGEMSEGRVKVKATQAKMARGEMVRWLTENQIGGIKEVSQFDGLGYSFMPDLSDEAELVFVKEAGRQR